MSWLKSGKVAALCASALICACATRPESRIAANRSAFDAYPAQTQEKIRNGEVEVGFTPEMARLALGDPDREYTRTTAEGTEDIWAYRDSGPRFGFGLGIGSFGSGLGGGLGVSTVGDAPDDKLRLRFKDGQVAAIERNAK